MIFGFGGLAFVGALAATPRSDPAPQIRSEEAPGATGLSVGVRFGWAWTFGNRVRGDAMSATYDGLLPVWLDVGYRVSRNVFVGAYFQYGFFFVGSSVCRSPAIEGCSGRDARAGGQLELHVRPQGRVDPWFGAGLGYEGASLTVRGSTNGANRVNDGFEFLHAGFGTDFPTDRYRVGPFIDVSMGEYRTENVQTPAGPSRTYAIASPGVHEFVFLGVRATYDL